MKNLLNFTNRQDDIRKVGNNPEIKIIVKEENGITEFEPIIKFDKERKFPDNAKVFIQAYSNEGYVGKPVQFGTVLKPDSRIVKDSDVGKDEIKFRLKVVSSEGKINKVLATCYKIAPWGTNTWLIIGTRDQDCLIEYEINPNDTPVLYFQKGYGLEKDLEQSNYLKSLHFNYAIREVLKTYILEEDNFIECKIRKIWMEHFQDLAGSEFPKKDDDDFIIKNFLNKSIKGFLEQQNQNLGGKTLLDVMPDSSVLTKDKLTFKGNNNENI